MRLRRVGIVAHTGKQTSSEIKERVEEWLEERGVLVSDEEIDLVLSIGGDGTMLRAAQRAHQSDVPLLGINSGTLGYLTEVDEGGELEALQRIFDGDYSLEDRMMLRCTAGENVEYVGLNEVLVERSSPRRLVRFGVRIGGEHLAAFNADGIIVATPTGSTAYALSAGGPIVDPRAHCLVVVPVSPHMIFSRPFVLNPDETVEITLTRPGQEAELSLDGGLGCAIGPGTTVVVCRHPRSLRLVRLSGPLFLERLRAKLKLPG